MHEFSSLHTHSPGRFLTTLNLHVQILDALFLLCRCSMRPYILRGAWVSLWFWYSHLYYLPVISWFYLYRIQLPFSFLYPSAIIVLDFICIIAVILILVLIYSLFQATLGLAYICEVFPRVYTSPTLVATPFPTYFGKRGMTVI